MRNNALNRYMSGCNGLAEKDLCFAFKILRIIRREKLLLPALGALLFDLGMAL